MKVLEALEDTVYSLPKVLPSGQASTISTRPAQCSVNCLEYQLCMT